MTDKSQNNSQAGREQEDETKIKETFHQFSSAMFDWEEAAAIFDEDDEDDEDDDEDDEDSNEDDEEKALEERRLWREETIKKRNTIYDRFLTEKKRAYSEPLVIEWPRKFDPILETITSVEINKRQATAYTVKKHPSGDSLEKRAFKFNKVGNDWFLDSMKIWIDKSKKWDACPI